MLPAATPRNELPGHRSKIPPAAVCRRGRTGTRDHDARQRDQVRPHRARLSALRPRGTGKTTLARIFAKALNATGGPKPEWDEDDPRVQEITQGRSLDVLEIDGASNNGVDAVRELRDTARFAPAAARLQDLHHRRGSHAHGGRLQCPLLKILEEPPAHVKFIFATTDPEKVLPTIPAAASASTCGAFPRR